jgi:serine/threonine protein kinase
VRCAGCVCAARRVLMLYAQRFRSCAGSRTRRLSSSSSSPSRPSFTFSCLSVRAASYFVRRRLMAPAVCEGGELFHQIVKLTYFSENLARHVILQVANGIRYLHEERGVVHRCVAGEE